MDWQRAKKAGVFCSTSNDTIRRTNGLPSTWTLKLTEDRGE